MQRALEIELFDQRADDQVAADRTREYRAELEYRAEGAATAQLRIDEVAGRSRWLADLPERPGWREAQPLTASDAAAVADLLAAASAGTGSPEFNSLAAPVVRADLATLRRLAAAAPETALAEADARAVIAVSLRAQCLLAPDDEAPTATCLML